MEAEQVKETKQAAEERRRQREAEEAAALSGLDVMAMEEAAAMEQQQVREAGSPTRPARPSPASAHGLSSPTLLSGC